MLQVASQLKSLGVTISHRRFDSHVAQSCHYLIRVLRHHVRALLTDVVAYMVACNIVASKLDYCYALLRGAPKATVSKFQQVQNNLARVV